jgi:endo-1,4-beta-xylanase
MGYLTQPARAAALFCAASAAWAQPALQDVFRDYFRIGAALNARAFTGQDETAAALVVRHCNTITPENVLKWVIVHPRPDAYDFGPGDRFVAFGEKHGMFIVGHTLVWHQQTPRWVFEDAEGKPLSREALLKRMREHIFTVVGRYRGRVHAWDVVNEALSDDGAMRPSPWLKLVGEDYVAKAFEYAREADPAAELYYNDYALEREPKRKGALELIGKLKRQGLKVTAVGLQGHDNLEFPSAQQQEETIEAFHTLGVKVAITELDLDVLPGRNAPEGVDRNPYVAGLPEEVAARQARRYAELFRVFTKYKGVITRVTFWGVSDATSWLNYFPIRGRTNYPLLFDREGKPKPAFDAVVETVKAH